MEKTVRFSTDIVRYYEKQGLISTPERQENGYRRYTEAHVGVLRFVRGAQALGFSLKEIRAILPQLVMSQLGRADLEQQLQAKMTEIDAHIWQLQTLKKELANTLTASMCSPTQAIVTASATAADSGSRACAALVRKAFSKLARR